MAVEDSLARHLTIKGREYLVSSAEKPVSQSESRLGKPDLVGEWKDNKPGKFRIYFLKNEQVSIIVDPQFPFTAFQERGNLIEGVIADDIGLSIFSGIMTTDSIVLSKTYSTLAKEKGAAREDISYHGKYNEASGSYVGKYSTGGKSGEFEIKRPEE